MVNKFNSFDIIPKPKLAIPRWVNLSLIGASVLVAVAGGLFFYFSFQTSSWDKKVQAKEADYAVLNTPENQALEKEVGRLSSQLEKFSEAFSARKSSAGFFDFLRTNCHPLVSFSALDFSVDTGESVLSGRTNSYQSLSEQAVILKDLPGVSNLSVSDISLSKEGEVVFKIRFTLNQDFFNKLKQ